MEGAGAAPRSPRTLKTALEAVGDLESAGILSPADAAEQRDALKSEGLAYVRSLGSRREPGGEAAAGAPLPAPPPQQADKLDAHRAQRCAARRACRRGARRRRRFPGDTRRAHRCPRRAPSARRAGPPSRAPCSPSRRAAARSSPRCCSAGAYGGAAGAPHGCACCRDRAPHAHLLASWMRPDVHGRTGRRE